MTYEPTGRPRGPRKGTTDHIARRRKLDAMVDEELKRQGLLGSAPQSDKNEKVRAYRRKIEAPPTAPEEPKIAETRAEKNIKWIEDHCRLPEGQFVGKPLVMPQFMRDDFVAIYDNPHGTRRAIISRGRKNAKTTECAAIILLHLCGREAKNKPNSQIFSTAQSREQAALVFSLAAKMVRMSPSLRSLVQIKDSGKELFNEHLGIRYRALSSEANTAFGLSPVLVIHDELGQVSGPVYPLYEAMESATAAQQEPLSIIISTQAPTDGDLLSILIDDAQAGHDKKTVLRMQSAPQELDPFEVDTIRLANPGFDEFMNKEEVLDMANTAKRMPSRENSFRNLVLNQRVQANDPFITQGLWKECGGDVQDLHGVPLYGGLDLSEVRDLTALVLIGRIGKVWNVKPTFWLPEEGLEEKSRLDRVPYDLWHSQGHLMATPGATVSYEYVAQYLRRLFSDYNIAKIGFDRWNMKHLKPWLTHAGFSDQMIEEKFVEFGQGTQSMSPALRDLEGLITDKLIAHANHPVLTMCAANAVVDSKDAANRKLSKNKSHGRIDGMVALAMAVGVTPISTTQVDVRAMIG